MTTNRTDKQKSDFNFDQTERKGNIGGSIQYLACHYRLSWKKWKKKKTLQVSSINLKSILFIKNCKNIWKYTHSILDDV